MTLKLIPDNDPRLHIKCDPFNPRKPDFDLLSTLDEMFQLMKMRDGMGLAAPQVGITKRFFIMDIDDVQFTCINPKILKSSKEIEVLREGCLSYPGQTVLIPRPFLVRVQYMTQTGLPKTKTLQGIKARCFQHELDHLNGKTLIDRGINNGSIQHN